MLLEDIGDDVEASPHLRHLIIQSDNILVLSGCSYPDFVADLRALVVLVLC